MARIRQSRPYSGLGVQDEVIQTFRSCSHFARQGRGWRTVACRLERGSLAHGRQSRPDSGLGVQVKVLKTLISFSRSVRQGCLRDLSVVKLLVQIHFIISVIWWTGPAPWEFELPLQGCLVSTFLRTLQIWGGLVTVSGSISRKALYIWSVRQSALRVEEFRGEGLE